MSQSARIVLGQFPLEIGLDEAIEHIDRLPAPAAVPNTIVAIGGTSPVHGDGKRVIQEFADRQNAVVVRASVERRGPVAFVCRPGAGVSSAEPGQPVDLGWTTIAIGLDDDVFSREKARAVAEAGARLYFTWPRFDSDLREVQVLDATARRARKNRILVAALFPSRLGTTGIAGAVSTIAGPDGAILARLAAGSTLVTSVVIDVAALQTRPDRPELVARV